MHCCCFLGMEDAIRDKHNSEIDGRRISVKEAIPQDQIPPEARGRDRYRAAARYPDRYDRLVAQTHQARLLEPVT